MFMNVSHILKHNMQKHVIKCPKIINLCPFVYIGLNEEHKARQNKKVKFDSSRTVPLAELARLNDVQGLRPK